MATSTYASNPPLPTKKGGTRVGSFLKNILTWVGFVALGSREGSGTTKLREWPTSEHVDSHWSHETIRTHVIINQVNVMVKYESLWSVSMQQHWTKSSSCDCLTPHCTSCNKEFVHTSLFHYASPIIGASTTTHSWSILYKVTKKKSKNWQPSNLAKNGIIKFRVTSQSTKERR